MKGKSNFPDIALVPANKSSAVVVSKGFSYEPLMKNERGRQEFDEKPITYPIPWNAENLTNQQCDRITLIGHFGEKGKWVGRCTCSRYVIRCVNKWKKSIKKNSTNMCQKCAKLEYIKNKNVRNRKRK